MRYLQYRGLSLVSKAIQLQTRSPYSHTAVQFSDGIIEAWHAGGRRPWTGTVRWIEHPWDGHAKNTPVDVYEVVGDYDEGACLAFAQMQIGKSYDFRSVFRFLSRRSVSSEDNDRWFCSELGVAIARAGGLNLLIGNPAHMSPRDIPMSPELVYKTSL